MKKESSLKAQWKAETDFFESLSKKYTYVKWAKGGISISDCPIGWRPIVNDMFAELNYLASHGVDYFDKGWVKIVTDKLNAIFDKLRLPNKLRFRRRFAKHRAEKPEIVIDQIKEKFADLRVYYSCNHERAQNRIRGIVSLAERICSRTCQISGQPGKLRTDKWYVVLSDKEYEKLNKKKNEKLQ